MPKTRSVEIGARLRESRVAAKMSPQEAGEASKCSPKTIYAFEAGTREIGAVRLACLCVAYGVSSDFILFGTHMVPTDLRDLFARASRGGAAPE